MFPMTDWINIEEKKLIVYFTSQKNLDALDIGILAFGAKPGEFYQEKR